MHPQHPAANEPGWTVVPERSPVTYTRPLLGAEFTHDLGHRLSDGLGDVCMGVTFKSTLADEVLENRCYEALGRLRFTAPVLACNIVSDPDDAFIRSWIYTSPTDVKDVHHWLGESLSVLRGAFTTDDFILSRNRTRTPYTYADGHAQIAHFYLLLGPDGTHGLFMHGPHTIMDARPTLRGLDLVLGWIADPPSERLEDLDWSEEWTRLPAGPVTATGGPRDDWGTVGVELLQESTRVRMNPVRTHTLKPSRETVQSVGNMLRAHELIDVQSSTRILRALKACGFSMSHLADAALALAVFAGNPITPEKAADAHFTMDPCVISQDKYLVPPHNGPSHFVAGLALVPLRVYYKDIPQSTSSKFQLLQAMEIVKKQYDHYISNPNLPHLLPVQLALYPPRQARAFDPHSSLMTNLGNVDSFVKSKWAGGKAGDDEPTIQVLDMAFGHRLGWQRLMNHVWSMNSMIHLQVQASDVWDMQFLREHLKRMKDIILSILDDDSTPATSSYSAPLPSQVKGADVQVLSAPCPSDSTNSRSSSGNSAPKGSKPATSPPEAHRSEITSTNEIPYPGYHFTPTIHHDTYPAIDPFKADFTGKIVFVSGASRGIGKAIAISFAKAGASGIVIAARSMSDLDDVEAEIQRVATDADRQTKVLKVYLDLLDGASVQHLVEQIRDVFWRLDVIVNNAATIDKPMPLSANDLDDWWTPFTANVRGTQSVTRALLPLLKASENGSKIIVNIVSSNALLATPYCSGYGLSKLALLQMSEILHKEHKADGVSVFAVHPGSVVTALTSMVPEGRRQILIDSLELCADTLVWLAKERRDWLSGRYVSATWDMPELECMKERIISEDTLRVTLAV